MSHRVVLYARSGCCLCEEARAVLERVRAHTPFSLSELDIDADERLLARYLERIPVVEVDGVPAFELFVDEDELRRRLEADAGRPRDAPAACPGAGGAFE